MSQAIQDHCEVMLAGAVNAFRKTETLIHTPSVPKCRPFDFSGFIDFAMYLDIHYI